MKKMIYIPFLLLIGGMANAEYIITVPLTKSGGGALSDDSINITSDWQNSSTEYGQWTNTGEVYGCSNWSPLASSITIGKNFTQTATDCSQNQVRTAQDKEIETISGIVQNKGASYIETKTITVSDTRDSVGTMETWIATTPTYTAWVNSGTISGCTNWNPSPSTVQIGQSFVQTATDCDQTQTRTRQNREIETITNQVRNVGSLINESQVITVSSSRNAIGSKQAKVCYYTFQTGYSGYSIITTAGYDVYNTNFNWDNILIGSNEADNLIIDGYKYTMGQHKGTKNVYGIIFNYYEICRESI